MKKCPCQSSHSDKGSNPTTKQIGGMQALYHACCRLSKTGTWRYVEMQSEETAARSGVCCQIVSIAEFGSRRAEKAARMEKWLEERVIEEYGDGSAIQNPLIRIITKFRALAEDGQIQLFRYAKNSFGGDALDKQLWNMLERRPEKMDRRDGWKMVEEHADLLLQKQFGEAGTAGGAAQ